MSVGDKVKLGSLGNFIRGKGIAKSDLVEEGGLPCIRYAEIYTEYGEVIRNPISRVSKDAAANALMLEYGDIIFPTSGETAEEIGKASAFVGQEETYVGGDTIILRGHEQDPIYLAHMLNSWELNRQKFRLATGNSVVHIYAQELSQLSSWLPNLDEQQKIVEILSDCDTVIEHVEQQVSLLTQVTNKSIKGLAENVGEPTKLSELCSPQQWQTISKSELLEEGIPVFGANGYIGYFSEANHHEDTIAVTCRGATSGEISWVKGPAYITGNAMCLDDVDENQIFKRYLYYQLGLGGIKKIISGSAQPQIIGEDISRFKVFVPTLDYQNMALNVFEAQVSEINLLRKQLALLKKQKSGLMQQLLTGKLRVKGAA